MISQQSQAGQILLHLQAGNTIKPVRTNPELILDVNNGRTLCKPCHIKTDSYGGKARKGTRIIKDPYGGI